MRLRPRHWPEFNRPKELLTSSLDLCFATIKLNRFSSSDVELTIPGIMHANASSQAALILALKRQNKPAQVFTLFRGLPSSQRHLDLVAPVATSLPEALPSWGQDEFSTAGTQFSFSVALPMASISTGAYCER
jgi:hypothetical protein